MIPLLPTSLQSYKGYDLRGPFFHEDDTWGAYTGGNGNQGYPWFSGQTAEEVKRQIDEALAAVPPPVY